VNASTMDASGLFGPMPGLDAVSGLLQCGCPRRAGAADQVEPGFLAIMCHELNTPMNAILGFSELLEMGVAGTLDPRQHEYVGLIHRSAQRLHAVIRQILELASADTGTIEAPPNQMPIRLAFPSSPAA
jgi:signal transduction histidine kinase